MGKVVKLGEGKHAEKMKEAQIKKRNSAKKWIFKATAVALLATIALFFVAPWYISIIPILIHVFLMFYTFAVSFYKSKRDTEIWARYVKKYGKNGVIPEHVKMTHKKLIAQGKKIKV